MAATPSQGEFGWSFSTFYNSQGQHIDHRQSMNDGILRPSQRSTALSESPSEWRTVERTARRSALLKVGASDHEKTPQSSRVLIFPNYFLDSMA